MDLQGFQTVNNHKALKTGGDPRALPDYAALRNELARLSHPARPDVSWERVEQLSLSLFRQNGVELQTLTAYTLARAHLAGINGLNEGLAILVKLIQHQWERLWPLAVPVRIELLRTLSKRLQQMVRAMTLTSADQGSLYQTEECLSRLCGVLQHLEIEQVSQFDSLMMLIHNLTTRMKVNDSISGCEKRAAQESVLPARIQPVSSVVDTMPPAPSKGVYVLPPEAERGNVQAPRLKPWIVFVAGMFSMLLISGALVWSWHFVHPPASPDLQWQQQLDAATLSTENLNGWHQGMTRLQQLADQLNALDEKRGKYITVSELKSATFDMLTHFRQTRPTEERLRQIQNLPENSASRQALIDQTEQHLRAQMSVLMQEKEKNRRDK